MNSPTMRSQWRTYRIRADIKGIQSAAELSHIGSKPNPPSAIEDELDACIFEGAAHIAQGTVMGDALTAL